MIRITYTVLLAIIFFLMTGGIYPVYAQSFSFGAAGDFANGSNFQGVIDAVARENPAFFLTLGDHSYSSGAEATWCGKWKAKYQNILLTTGNHDSGESNGGNINTYIQHCPFTLSGLQGTYGHQYYFDYPASAPLARFIMIRPGVGGSGSIDYNAGQPGYTFTQSSIDDARGKNIPWIVVGFHKNYISALEKSNEIGTDLMKLLLDKKVDLILQGHEHGYERSKQLSTGNGCTTLPTKTYNPSCVVDSDNNLQKGAGSVIHVLGTGGQGLRGLYPNDSEYPYFASADNTSNGFGKYTVTSSQISFNFIASRGSFSDSFTIGGTGAPSQPLPTVIPTITPTIIPGQPTPTPQLYTSPTTAVVPTVPIPTPTPLAPCASFPQTTGSVTMSTTTNQGTYKVWARMQGQNTISNAFYLQVDDQCPVVVGDTDTMPANTWEWIDYKNGQSTDKLFFQLTAGSHVFKISAKEPGTRLDAILLTADQACVPFEMGTNCTTPTVNTGSAASPTSGSGTSILPTSTPSLPPGGKTILPTADSYSSDRNTTQRNGIAHTLHIDGSPTEAAYLKFDLSGFSGTPIQKALLVMVVSNSSRQTQTVHLVPNSSWTEATLTNSNKPSMGAVIGNLNGGTTGSTIILDLTTAIKQSVGGLMSIGIQSKDSDGLFIYSRETTSRTPKLVIYEEVPQKNPSKNPTPSKGSSNNKADDDSNDKDDD